MAEGLQFLETVRKYYLSLIRDNAPHFITADLFFNESTGKAVALFGEKHQIRPDKFMSTKYFFSHLLAVLSQVPESTVDFIIEMTKDDVRQNLKNRDMREQGHAFGPNDATRKGLTQIQEVRRWAANCIASSKWSEGFKQRADRKHSCPRNVRFSWSDPSHTGKNYGKYEDNSSVLQPSLAILAKSNRSLPQEISQKEMMGRILGIEQEQDEANEESQKYVWDEWKDGTRPIYTSGQGEAKKIVKECQGVEKKEELATFIAEQYNELLLQWRKKFTPPLSTGEVIFQTQRFSQDVFTLCRILRPPDRETRCELKNALNPKPCKQYTWGKNYIVYAGNQHAVYLKKMLVLQGFKEKFKNSLQPYLVHL